MKAGENVWVEINRQKEKVVTQVKEVVIEKPIEVEKVVEKIIYKYPLLDFFKALFKRKK